MDGGPLAFELVEVHEGHSTGNRPPPSVHVEDGGDPLVADGQADRRAA
jgi:hypothetical protein